MVVLGLLGEGSLLGVAGCAESDGNSSAGGAMNLLSLELILSLQPVMFNLVLTTTNQTVTHRAQNTRITAAVLIEPMTRKWSSEPINSS